MQMSIRFIDLETQHQRLAEDITKRIQQVFSHGQYIMGPEIAELEEKLAEFTGAKHAITVSDGTTALQIALMALNIEPGDEIVTTPFTFIATAETIALLGAKPVFVDIEPDSYNIDPQKIEVAISPKTKAIMPVSLYGQCADFHLINQIAERYKLAVIEDAAQSFGATYHGKRSCNLSMISCTSFFPSKPLGCYGDGGACFTNDDQLAQQMKQIRIHGQDKRYHHPRIGLNGRLDTLQAAILLAKLPSFPEDVQARIQVGIYYSKHLKDTVQTPIIGKHRTSVYAQYTIQVNHREIIQEKLKAVGIPTAVHYPVPLHLQPAFRYLNYQEGDFPIAESAAKKVLSLPMHPFLDQKTQQKIINEIKAAI